MNVGSGQMTTRLLTIAGYSLLATWLVWWGWSLSQQRFVGSRWTWVPAYFITGVDFNINYYASQHWAAGGNPYDGYRAPYHTADSEYEHPPLVLILFSWCAVTPRDVAYLIWMLALIGIAGVSARASWRSRIEQGLGEIPWPMCVAAILCSYPFLFELERGNWNLLVMPGLLVGVWGLNKKTTWGDVVAGAAFGLAVWVKLYPGLLLLGLVALSRWRAAFVCAATMLAVGLADVPHTLQFADNIKRNSLTRPDNLDHYIHGHHTISGSWKLLKADLGIRGMGKIPGTLGGALVVLPLVCLVSYQVWRSPNRSRLVYPYLVWLVAAASYVPANANDYSLTFLPLAALAICDRRDPWWLKAMMLSLVLWWQPVALPISPRFMFYDKLLGLGVVSVSLIYRARQVAQPAEAAIVSPTPIAQAA